MEHLLLTSQSIIQNMNDAQKAHFESQMGKNTVLLVVSNNQGDNGETMTNEKVDDVNKTIH